MADEWVKLFHVDGEAVLFLLDDDGEDEDTFKVFVKSVVDGVSLQMSFGFKSEEHADAYLRNADQAEAEKRRAQFVQVIRDSGIHAEPA